MGRKRTAHPRSRKGEKTEGAGKKSKSRARAQEPELQVEQPAPKGTRGGYKRVQESMTGKKSIKDPETGETLWFNLDDPEEKAAHMRIVQKYTKTPGAAKPGAKVKIDKLIDKRKLKSRLIWKKYQYLINYKDPKTGRHLSKEQVKQGMVEYIYNQTGEKVSKKTWDRWLERNPPIDVGVKYDRWDLWVKPEPPPEAIIPPAFQKWVIWANRKFGVDHGGYDTGINNFLAWRERQGLNNDPDDWTTEEFIEEFKDWQESLTDGRQGKIYSVGSAQNYSVAIRSVLRHGVRMPSDIYNRLEVSGAGRKKFPETIHYLRDSELERLYANVPTGRIVAYHKVKEQDGVEVVESEYANIRNREAQLMYRAAMRFSATTGARCGGVPKTNSITPHLYVVHAKNRLKPNKDLYNMMTFGKREGGGSKKAARGVVGMRLEDVRFNAQIRYIDLKTREEKEMKACVVRRIHEKMDHTWKDFAVPPKTAAAIDEYLRERFKLGPDADLDAFIASYAREQKAEFTKQQRQGVRELQQMLDSGVTKDAFKKKQDAVARDLLKTYQNQLLFERKPHVTNPSPDFRKAVYAAVNTAEAKGESLRDERGEVFSAERLKEDPEEGSWHILRKSFAQNMRERDVPLDVLARLAVGWDDLTTLEKLYAKLPQKKKNAWFVAALHPTF